MPEEQKPFLERAALSDEVIAEVSTSANASEDSWIKTFDGKYWDSVASMRYIERQVATAARDQTARLLLAELKPLVDAVENMLKEDSGVAEWVAIRQALAKFHELEAELAD